MGWFESQSTKEKKSTVMNVLVVMQADGKITDSEKEILSGVCRRVGLSQKEYNEILDNPKKVKFTPAKDGKERLEQLIDAIYMMMADGEIDKLERDICMSIATKLDFRPSLVDDLVNKIIQKFGLSKEKEVVQVELEAFLEK